MFQIQKVDKIKIITELTQKPDLLTKLPHWNNQGNKPSFLFECVSPIIIAIPSEGSEKSAILRQKAEGTKVVGIFKKVCDFT